MTPRIMETASIVPYLLAIYFDVMISYAEDAQLRELVPVIFQRIDQVFLLLIYVD